MAPLLRIGALSGVKHLDEMAHLVIRNTLNVSHDNSAAFPSGLSGNIRTNFCQADPAHTQGYGLPLGHRL